MPIGPAARARAAQLEVADGAPPSADAFWSEDSAALHDAVQAPPAASGHRQSPPVGLVAPVAGRWHPRLRRPSGLRSPRVVRARWTLVAVPAAAVAALAMLAMAVRPTGHRTAAHTGPVYGQNTTVAQDSAASASGTLPKAGAATSTHRTHHARHTRAHPRVRNRVAGKSSAVRKSQAVHKRRQPAPVTHQSATKTVTEASVTPVTTAQTTPASTSSSISDRSSETASTAASAGSKPPTSPGPIGIGSMSGRCNPRCP